MKKTENELLEKLRYQISVIGETIDSKSYPIQSLIINNNWSGTDINKVYDIFEDWEKKIQAGIKMTSSSFEKSFNAELGISYQGLKPIIRAFYKAEQFSEVCECYVDSFEGHQSIEYNSIAKRER